MAEYHQCKALYIIITEFFLHAKAWWYAKKGENDRVFEAYKPKIRKSGTGGLYQISENLWEGSFYPRLPDGTRKKFNVYAKTKAECEKKVAKMIAEKKAEIAKQKKVQKKGWRKVSPL